MNIEAEEEAWAAIAAQARQDERQAVVGRSIVCDGEFAPVLDVIDHAPGTHPQSPINDRYVAREYRTARGSRWTGLHADGTPYVVPGVM